MFHFSYQMKIYSDAVTLRRERASQSRDPSTRRLQTEDDGRIEQYGVQKREQFW